MTTAIRSRQVARATGTTVEVVDTWAPDALVADDGGRWSTVCVEHGGVCSHQTLADAKGWAPHPDEWCPTCQDQRQIRTFGADAPEGPDRLT